jgi:hypothetical protein
MTASNASIAFEAATREIASVASKPPRGSGFAKTDSLGNELRRPGASTETFEITPVSKESLGRAIGDVRIIKSHRTNEQSIAVYNHGYKIRNYKASTDRGTSFEAQNCAFGIIPCSN